ncbi:MULTISPECIES: flavodoxin domain-containing protein [Treponema]|uniref:Flavodoxin/nitric oxide synthase n=1 Tax=Treponema saccharophilum DSM 2985 TaxID=907348 RepID=H7ENJ6_9SPIR|nr:MULTISPECIES: flavodoxin domain-containing protein [Treponema]EIC00924.1 flavodoxin/nitric oxide synthase [Treponema saccharophilum DSM 2985]MBQ5537203.1 flavodoxin domain-containing protein [Treponema sp.]BDC95155.1 flavodoxin [Treponema saccharophilum]
MAKVAIVYASTTGNTEALANAAKEAAGADAYFSTADAADSAEVLASDLILLGSPAMGAEQLEDSQESFFSGIEGQLSGKKVGLFGSYDWGDGQFLSDWADRVTAAGGTVVGTVKAQLSPDEAALSAVKELASR